MFLESFTLLFEPLLQTVYMVCASAFFSCVAGIPLGIILFSCKNKYLHLNPTGYWIISAGVNILRSIPYIILMIALIPISRLLTGTSIGTNAAIVSLTVAAIPFVARLIETALGEVPNGLIETGLSIGASSNQILFYILLPEALPAIVQGITLTLINLVGYSAMAGAIGGGGLGDLAIRYGYQRFDITIMILTILVLILLVQIIQTFGNKLSACLDKR